MIRTLLFLLAIFSAISLQVTFKAHFASAPVIDVTALRAAELQKHNSYRALHGSPALTLSDSLNTIAQNYADTIANSHNLTHSDAAKNGTYGENLYWGWGYPTLTYLPGTASDRWYSEQQNYNYATFKTNDPTKTVGHFTALIWKSVTSVGFGYTVVAEKEGYAIYVVANYSPTPNVLGQYATNVPKPL